MNDSSVKPSLPAYVSFQAFVNFINRLRETTVPNRIDRSVMGNQSGSLMSALAATLRSFELIDEAQRPTAFMRELVNASDDERKILYRKLFEQGYANFLNDPEFHLETATTNQLSQKFRDLGVGGSTITKCIAYFLNLAKTADIKVSPHMKTPTVKRVNGTKSPRANKRDAELEATAIMAAEIGNESSAEGVERFEIPIPGKPSVRVIVPNDLDADDWEMLQSMITVYIKRWKGFKPGGGSNE